MELLPTHFVTAVTQGVEKGLVGVQWSRDSDSEWWLHAWIMSDDASDARSSASRRTPIW